MSRFSYSLDISEELEREKQVKRRIAHQRATRDEEDPIKLDPKFEAEIQALAEEKPSSKPDEEALIITPKQMAQPKNIAKSVSKKHELKRAAPKKVVAKRQEPKRSVSPKRVPKKVTKKPKKDTPKPAVAKPSVPKETVKEPEKKVEPAKEFNVPAEPSVPVQPAHTEPRTPSEGTGRLVLALLLVSLLAILLIYTGLAAEQSSESDIARYAQFAETEGRTPVTFGEASEIQQFWLKRAMLTSSEPEAAALVGMALCDEQELTEESNPLDFQECDISTKYFVVTEADLRELVELSTQSPCDSLADVIICDNGYLIDGLRALKDAEPPAHLIAKSGGSYTILDSGGNNGDALAVMSDKKNNFVAHTLYPEYRNSMAMRLFVGDQFQFFQRVYLDHYPGSERAAVYVVD